LEEQDVDETLKLRLSYVITVCMRVWIQHFKDRVPWRRLKKKCK